MTEKDKQRITMEQFNDISKHVEKAQGDKARFLKSKEGLLPHFEFPTGETQEEKQFSKETLLADIMDERIEKAKEMMENPILLENVYRDLQNNATQGSKKEGENRGNASWAFHALSALISTNFFSHLSFEKQNKINSHLENPTLLENAYRELQNSAIQSSEKEGKNITDASLALWTISALISTNSLSRFFPRQQSEIASYLENPILLENAYRDLQYDTTQGSQKERENTDNAHWAFRTLFAFITTGLFSRLSPEKQNEINSYLENPILLENAYRDLQYDTTQGSEKEGKSTSHAYWSFQTLSAFATIKDYLREKGKKIDDENFAKEALNPTEKIPPRPEGRLGK